MNIDLEKAKKISDDLAKTSDLISYQETFNKFCTEIKYFDDPKNKPSSDLSDNENYKNLNRYVLDATFVIAFANYDVDSFIDSIKETETDLHTYLENYVNDDTDHGNIKDYLLKDFKSIEQFSLHLLRSYFTNNFYEYLKKLS